MAYSENDERRNAMTTATMTIKQNGLGKITGLVLLILAIVAIIPFMGKGKVAAVPLPEIQTDPANDHAYLRHGEVVYEIRDCLKAKGSFQVWRSSDKKYYYALCQLMDGRYGIREFMWLAARNVWWEVTAFVPKDGTFNTVTKYLSGFATRFKGPFPWE
jgi:hypothetical protein